MRNKVIEKLLYKSLDTTLSEKESKILNDELRRSKQMNEQYLELIKIRKAIGDCAVTSFKISFEERLSDKLNKFLSGATYFNSWTNSLATAFRRIAISAMIFLIFLVLYNLKSGNKYSIENLLGTSNTTIVSAFDPIQNLIERESQ